MQYSGRNLIISAALFSLLPAGTSPGIEGPVASINPPPSDHFGDWCAWWSNKPGTIYKDDNPWLHELRFFGRFQWQAAYVMGSDTNGYGFSDDYTEARRFRLGLKSRFLKYFELNANLNLVNDRRPGGRDIDWGYQDFDEAYLTFMAGKAFGINCLDSLEISYGRLKHRFSNEIHTSSRNLLTPERSAIANKLYGSYRPTGLSVEAIKGPWDITAILYSTDQPRQALDQVDLIGGWNDGLAYYTSIAYEASDELHFHFDFIYNDAEATKGDDSIFAYKWATSLAAVYERDRWGLIANVMYGDNGDADNGARVANRQGDFWGLVVMPYYWIVEDHLQAVVRYQYAGAQNSRGIRTNSRYIRRDHGPVVNANIGGGRGDEHHSIYAGLNYYFCGHSMKVQAGVEHEFLNVPGAGIDGDVTATTLWFAFRSYF